MTCYEKAAALLREGRSAVLVSDVDPAGGQVAALHRRVEEQNHPERAVRWENGMFREPVLLPRRLLIFGGGHVGRALTGLASPCGFAVTVVDDRAEFADPARFPGARTLCGDPATAMDALVLRPEDSIAILTRGHARDGDALRAALARPETAYLGMIGSRRRVSAMLDQLAAEGVDPGRLARVHTPIGLPIGAVTPAEIAVSILAELIACRRLSDGEPVLESELDPAVLEALARDGGPRAVATILSARGHTPRGAGAKLALWPDGQIVGTIGGGSAEALAMRRARALTGAGRYEVLSVHLNADVAAREGMACGGEMRILVEDDSPQS